MYKLNYPSYSPALEPLQGNTHEYGEFGVPVSSHVFCWEYDPNKEKR